MSQQNIKMYKSAVLTNAPAFNLHNTLTDLKQINVQRGLRFEKLIETYQKQYDEVHSEYVSKILRLKKLFQDKEQQLKNESIKTIHEKFKEHSSKSNQMYVMLQLSKLNKKRSHEFAKKEQDHKQYMEHQELNYKLLQEQQLLLDQKGVNTVALLDKTRSDGESYLENYVAYAKTYINSRNVYTIVIADIQYGRPEIQTIVVEYPVTCIHLFKIDQKVHLIVADEEKTFTIYELGLQQRIVFEQKFNMARVQSIQVLQNGTRMVSCHYDSKLVYWGMENQQLTWLQDCDSVQLPFHSFKEDIENRIVKVFTEHEALEFKVGVFQLEKLVDLPLQCKFVQDVDSQTQLFLNPYNEICLKTGSQVHDTRLPIKLDELRLFSYFSNKLILSDQQANLYHIDKILDHFN